MKLTNYGTIVDGSSEDEETKCTIIDDSSPDTATFTDVVLANINTTGRTIIADQFVDTVTAVKELLDEEINTTLDGSKFGKDDCEAITQLRQLAIEKSTILPTYANLIKKTI